MYALYNKKNALCDMECTMWYGCAIMAYLCNRGASAVNPVESRIFL